MVKGRNKRWPFAICHLPFVLPLAANAELAIARSSAAVAPATLTMVHPTEGQRLPPLSQIFVFGAVTPGSTLTLNGSRINAHPSGGYLSMVSVSSGDFVISAETQGPAGDSVKLDRPVYVAPGFVMSPSTPSVIEKGSVAPFEDAWLAAGDRVRVSFQGSPGGVAEFSIEGAVKKIPMTEAGLSTASRRGIYEGLYIIQPGDKAHRASIEATLKKDRLVKEKAGGRLTIDNAPVPRVGIITEDAVAARTGPEGGYDLFLYRGMRVRLTGKAGNQWRVRFSSIQSGWVKESAVQELPPGAPPAESVLGNFTIAHQEESTIIRVPLGEALPYRAEQSRDPMQLAVTLYGAVAKTDLIRYDPLDSLIRQARWRQIASDTVQLVIEPKFRTWWGYDVRYEGSTLIIEVRKPWPKRNLRGLVVAVDPGHGGSETGATGPRGTLEKEANLQIARAAARALERAGAKPFLTREKDVDASLYERPRLAWNRNARLFVSVHCNAAGVNQNPVWNNGFSAYWYHPQSQALAEKVHAEYGKRLSIPDHGLYFADFAVCRMTQMPSILVEQAFIIVPEQEQLLFDPQFQKNLAASIVNGIKNFVANP